ncbi:adenosine deaminase [Homoserinimonas hongtaonis]|uniref:Adenine deaminase n=1 Tax=Homoserinimonas hongtaonis TaxID=2079791 RepID=A0A2U1SZW7_9MICO|nr:adenosine deaminase [Salinibacterium hongtaonis]PWB97157.1 adenosine deaminase [Salinibacterium hongtaonis]
MSQHAPAHSLLGLPKAELHLHIEGTFEPELVFALAARNGIELPYASVEELRQSYSFDGLVSFLDLYYECMAVLRTERDFYELAMAYYERASAQGVRHAEIFFDPQAHTSRGVSIDTVIDGLSRAAADAHSTLGITGGLIMCFLRDLPVSSAHETLESVAHRVGDLIGVGLDSAEAGFPPSLFAEVYSRAAELGLRLVAHAGEEGPSDYVWEALRLLKVERIDHGVRSLEDSDLVDYLRENRIPLTVCPLSNLRLGGHVAFNALPALIEAGLFVTVNSDDPAYFGGYVGDNFTQIERVFGLSQSKLVELAQNSVVASFAPDSRKQQLLAEIDEWIGVNQGSQLSARR